MKFLGFLKGLETKDDQTVRATAGSVGAYTGMPYLSGWDVERAVRDGFERSIWAYRSVHAIADNASRLRMLIREGDPDEGKEVKDHPLLPLLNHRTNHYEKAKAFRYRLSAQIVMNKLGAFVEVKRTKGGGIEALHLLPPHRTRVIADLSNFVDRFEVVTKQGIMPVPAENVAWIKNPHPLDPYDGSTAFEPAGLSMDLDFWTRLYNRSFMQNDGRPGGILNVKGEFDPVDGEELKRRFGPGGPQNAGRTSVINSDGVDFVDTALSPRDAQYVQQRLSTKEDILMAQGVTETVAGNASERTFANADAEEEIFWRVTMLSHLGTIGGGLDDLTSPPGEDDDLYIVHDTADVWVLGRDKRENEAHLLDLFDAGLISADEFREATGRDPFDRAESKALWVTAGKFPIAEGDDEEQGLLVNETNGTLPESYQDPNAQQQPQGPGVDSFGGFGGGGGGGQQGNGQPQGNGNGNGQGFSYDDFATPYENMQGGQGKAEVLEPERMRDLEPWAWEPVWLDGLASERG